MVTNKSLSFRLGGSRFWPLKLSIRPYGFSYMLPLSTSFFFNSSLSDSLFRDRGVVHSHNQVTFGRSQCSSQLFIQDAKLLDFFNTFPRKNLFSIAKVSRFKQNVTKKSPYQRLKNKFFFKKKNLFFNHNRVFSILSTRRFCYNFSAAKNRFIQMRLRRSKKYMWKRQQYHLGFRELFYSQKNFRSCFFLFFSRFFSSSIFSAYATPSKIDFKHVPLRATNANIYLNYMTAKLYYRYILSDVVNPIVRLSLKLYRGFAINCKGRFTRAQMASQKHYRKGSLSFGKVSTPIDYAQKSVVLKYGVCNFKLWIRHLSNIYITILFMSAHKTKKAMFKIWPKGFKQNVFFANYFLYTPHDLPTFVSYNYPFAPANKPIRLRVICVRAKTYGYLSSKAIEAFRKVIAPYFRKKSYYNIKFNILVYPYIPLTKKPAEVRMGGGKGAKIRDFISPIKPGQILFTTTAFNAVRAKKLMNYASRKLGVPVSISFILKNDFSK